MTDFSKQIKEGTKESHSAAENTKFVAQFLKGVLDPTEYRKLITDFWYVYTTMEDCIRNSDDPLVKQIYFKELERVECLEKDLLYYYGPNWKDEAKPSEPCNTYCYRINEVAEKNPYLLIAHHYTRYIGDLSGGKILGGIAEKALNPPVGEGLNFYDFPDIYDAKIFKTNYRRILDELEIDEQQINALITEANYAFRLNMYLFDELQGSATKSLIKVLCGLVREKILGQKKPS